MRKIVGLVVCLAALAADTEGQHGHGGPQGTNPNGHHNCFPGWLRYKDSCYKVEGAFLTVDAQGNIVERQPEGWNQNDAEAHCNAEYNAHLVTVGSVVEHDALWNTMVPFLMEPSCMWIGLYGDPTGWMWFNGEPYNASLASWFKPDPADPDPSPEAGIGGVIFGNIPGGQGSTPKWTPKPAATMMCGCICEYHLQHSMPTEAPTTTAPPNQPTTQTTSPPTTQPTTQPATQAPVRLNQKPQRLGAGLTFGGSGLHEVLRPRNGPSNIKMNPYHAIQP